jgi:hypothetical protein
MLDRDFAPSLVPFPRAARFGRAFGLVRLPPFARRFAISGL